MRTVEKERNETVCLYTHLHTEASPAIYGYFPLEHSSTPLYSKSLSDALSPGTYPFSTIPNNVNTADCQPLTVLIPHSLLHHWLH